MNARGLPSSLTAAAARAAVGNLLRAWADSLFWVDLCWMHCKDNAPLCPELLWSELQVHCYAMVRAW